MNTRRRMQLGDDRTPDVAAASDLDRRRLAEALDAVGDAIVVVDAAGEVVLRNRSADRFHDARHADALAGGALRELLDRARNGEECSRELQWRYLSHNQSKLRIPVFYLAIPCRKPTAQIC